MTQFPIGFTDKFRITIRKSGELYDPETVQASFVKGDGSEDTLTYGGSAARDSQLTRVSVGIYEVWYKYDVPGEWRVNDRWLDNGGDVTVIDSIESVYIVASPFSWADHV